MHGLRILGVMGLLCLYFEVIKNSEVVGLNRPQIRI